MSDRAHHLCLLITALVFAGCLPHSCQRTETSELFPSDSLSREIAFGTETDTLEFLWSYTGNGSGLEYPRNLLWNPEGKAIHVGDTGSGQITVLSTDGLLRDVVRIPGMQHPYLAGWRGDTLVVLDPDRRQLLYTYGSTIARAIGLPLHGEETRSYLYATVTSGGSAVKAVRRGAETVVFELSHEGDLKARRALDGPYWRHAGFLIQWGNEVLSLCGYRPIVDVLRPSHTDSLLLQGFDSPMLSRSRRFVLGAVEQPPLLIGSAAAWDAYLFVLNLRPGRLRVDAYDRSGMIHRILTGPSALELTYFPADIAVSGSDSGEILIAVSATEPTGRVDLYRWRAGAADRFSVPLSSDD